MDRRGWPAGWWFEGLTAADIAVGSRTKWLAFPEERERALMADRFFAAGITSAEVRALAEETGTGWLVFRARDWIGWERWMDEQSPAVAVAYDDGEFMIIDVRPDARTDAGPET